LIDLFPPLCDIARIDKPSYLQGSSFIPLVENPEKEWKSAAFSQFHRKPKITPDAKRHIGYSNRSKTHHNVEWDYEKGVRGEFIIAEL